MCLDVEEYASGGSGLYAAKQSGALVVLETVARYLKFLFSKHGEA